ncbi:MAG: hypothetical protein IPK50_00185 [Fibrobacterota bacterium]|nr:hypothetical protein [Fibrobacterota bacterium]QQS05338.1 MAG: hypothetical protein IPK50_00185 [Fibrobacterota bacterium]
MNLAIATLVAAFFGAPRLELDSLRLSVFYEFLATGGEERVYWPGLGVDVGFAPWHAQYVHQRRFFGNGLEGDENFLDAQRPHLEKYRHRLSVSRQGWHEFVRWELGAGWVWSRLDALEMAEDTRDVKILKDGQISDDVYARIVWYRMRSDIRSRPVVFAAIGGAPRRWLTAAVRVEYTGVVGLGVSFEGNFL